MPEATSCLVIVPVHDEAGGLARLLESLGEIEHDVLVVDDASNDDSAAIAESLGFDVLRLPFNLGIGGAVQAGFQQAVARGHDVAVQFDGDGQHRLEHLEELLDAVRQGADVVIGSRFLTAGGHKSTPVRRIGIRLFSFLATLLSRTRITDCTSGYRALSRDALRFCARHYPVDFPDLEALLLMARAGFRIEERPVLMNPRASGKSSTNWVKSLYYPFSNAVAIYSALTRVGIARVERERP